MITFPTILNDRVFDSCLWVMKNMSYPIYPLIMGVLVVSRRDNFSDTLEHWGDPCLLYSIVALPNAHSRAKINKKHMGITQIQYIEYIYEKI